MKVIKPSKNTDGWWLGLTVKCRYCEMQVELERDDKPESVLPYDGPWHSYDVRAVFCCPGCGGHILVDMQDAYDLKPQPRIL